MTKPRLSRPSGEALPARFRALRALFASGPRPLRAALLYATPRLIAPRLPAFVARYPDGRAFELPANEGPYAQIFTLGEFEPVESETVRMLLRPGDFAVDVGANLGWFTVLTASCVKPNGEVWAIEPMPPTIAALERNLELNPELAVRLQPFAVGAEDGELDLHLFAGLSHGHASAATLDRTDFATYRVQVRTLDRLLEQQPSPAFVKIDVEGSELDVLRGAERLLSAERPPMWMIEVNYETGAAFGYRPVDLLEPFRARPGYDVYRIATDGLVAEREPKTAPNGSNWVVVPEGYRDRLTAPSSSGTAE